MIRRINVIGGPGCGKTVMAAGLFTRLKKLGHNVELIDEYVKAWAYQGRQRKKYDQLILFARQLDREYLVLSSVDDIVIVTESPSAMSVPYARMHGFPEWESLLKIAMSFERDFPSYNIFLERNDCPYEEVGRYETIDEAEEMDRAILSFMSEDMGVPLAIVGYDQEDMAFELVKGALSRC